MSIVGKGLDLEKLKNRKHKFISSEESLKDVIPFEWSDEVLSGKKKVTVGSIYDNMINVNKENNESEE